MKKAILLLLIPVLLMAAGCKKNTGAAVIKTITYPVSNEVYTYEYNTNGWINSIDGSLGDFTTFLNLGSTIVVTQYGVNGNIISITTYYVNEQQLVDSIVVVSGSLSSNYANTYNANGYLVSQKQYDASNNLINIVTDSIVNGNTITEKGTGTLMVNTFNDHGNTIGNNNMGQPFLGKDSKNLPSSSNATGTGETNYTYTYDSDGRVTSRTVNNVTNNSSTTYYYTYY